MSDAETFDPILVLSRILRRHAMHLNAPHACVLLQNSESDDLTIEYGMGVMESYVGRIIRMGDGVAGQVMATKKPMFIPDYLEWAQRYQRLIPSTRNQFNIVAGTPVFRDGALWAILSFIWDDLDLNREAEIVATLEEMSATATDLIARMVQITEPAPLSSGDGFIAAAS